jgi:hypothetical protein
VAAEGSTNGSSSATASSCVEVALKAGSGAAAKGECSFLWLAAPALGPLLPTVLLEPLEALEAAYAAAAVAAACLESLRPLLPPLLLWLLLLLPKGDLLPCRCAAAKGELPCCCVAAKGEEKAGRWALGAAAVVADALGTGAWGPPAVWSAALLDTLCAAAKGDCTAAKGDCAAAKGDCAALGAVRPVGTWASGALLLLLLALVVLLAAGALRGCVLFMTSTAASWLE